MGKSCCESKTSEIEQLRHKQGAVLKWVLLINSVMFVIEFTAGLLSHSSALMADSLDMLGDAAVYAFSLFALNRGARWRARAGLLKGYLMAFFGLFVLGQAVYRYAVSSLPTAETMTYIGALALLANLTCLALLYRHKSDDINMRSTWLCSRNDIISNVGVITASMLVAKFNSGIPDIIVGVIIAGLFLKDAISIVSDAKKEMRELPAA